MKRWIVVCVFTILLPSFAWGQKDSTDTVSSYENRFIRPLVDGDARVRVGVVPVAGEVLEDRRHPRVPDRADRRRHKFARRRGVSAERARVDKVARVGGYVAHRRKVHVDAERQKLLVIVQRLRGKTVHAARGIQLLRRGQRLREELRVAARVTVPPSSSLPMKSGSSAAA